MFLHRCGGNGFDHHTGVMILHGFDSPPMWWSTSISFPRGESIKDCGRKCHALFFMYAFDAVHVPGENIICLINEKFCKRKYHLFDWLVIIILVN